MTGVTLRWNAVCLDCADAEEMAAFYGRLLGWKISGGSGRWIAMQDPEGGVGLIFQARGWYRPPTWPERRDSQHKMMHFEMKVDSVEAAVSHAAAAGARVAAPQPRTVTRPRSG